MYGTDALFQKISMDIVVAFEKYILMNASTLERMDKGNGILLTMPFSAQSVPDWHSINPKIL